MGISVCMINRNGAATLHRCLESVKPFADEIIFTDTGSTDHSIAIAQEFGAKIFHFKWIDNFAAARNFCIQHATQDKILQMDSDDVVPEDCCHGFVSIKNKPIDCYVSFVIHNVNVVKRDPPIPEKFMQARLFPNFRGIEYGPGAGLSGDGRVGNTDGTIHESFVNSAILAGINEERCVGVIEHHGYSDPEALREKDDRNIRLYMKMFGATEDHSWSWFNVGEYRCVYVPNVATIWHHMKLLGLVEPFSSGNIPEKVEERWQHILNCVIELIAKWEKAEENPMARSAEQNARCVDRLRVALESMEKA